MGPVKSKPKRVAAYKHNETSMFTNALETKEFSLVHDDRVSCVAAYKPGWCVSGSTDCVSLIKFLLQRTYNISAWVTPKLKLYSMIYDLDRWSFQL